MACRTWCWRASRTWVARPDAERRSWIGEAPIRLSPLTQKVHLRNREKQNHDQHEKTHGGANTRFAELEGVFVDVPNHRCRLMLRAAIGQDQNRIKDLEIEDGRHDKGKDKDWTQEG